MFTLQLNGQYAVLSRDGERLGMPLLTAIGVLFNMACIEEKNWDPNRRFSTTNKTGRLFYRALKHYKNQGGKS